MISVCKGRVSMDGKSKKLEVGSSVSTICKGVRNSALDGNIVRRVPMCSKESYTNSTKRIDLKRGL